MGLTSCCLKSQTAWTGNLPLIAVVGLRGFSWMTDFALLFKSFTRVLNSFSCSLSSWGWINSSYHDFGIFIKTLSQNLLSKLFVLTAASCSRSSSRVVVVVRSQLYFFLMLSCIFLILSWASFTSEKNCKENKSPERKILMHINA